MARKRLIAAVAGLSLAAVVAGQAPRVGAQGGRGQLRDSYREGNGARPAWVNDAAERSFAFLATDGKGRDSLALVGADRDDIATHVRLDQVFRGVPVFGGQVLTHLSDTGAVVSNGRFYNLNKIDTRPAFDGAKAIELAKSTLGYVGEFASSPSAKLVILPLESKTVLAYQVGLLVEDGTDATAFHQYFINAQDGSVALYFNALDTEFENRQADGSDRGDWQWQEPLQRHR